MHDRIAGLPFERQLRILSPHPHIEPLMQKQIRQQGADDGLNAKDNMGRAGASVAAEVPEAAAAPHSDRVRKSVSESSVGW